MIFNNPYIFTSPWFNEAVPSIIWDAARQKGKQLNIVDTRNSYKKNRMDDWRGDKVESADNKLHTESEVDLVLHTFIKNKLFEIGMRMNLHTQTYKIHKR